jgi:hypothetical protein
VKSIEDNKCNNTFIVSKNRVPTRIKSIRKQNAKNTGCNKRTTTHKKNDKIPRSNNTVSGILELFELDKEYILLYHLAMLESKIM